MSVIRLWTLELQKKYGGGVKNMNAKLFKPKLLRRKRIDKLFEGILEFPLFILLSSMGYGKTTAVKDFLNSKPNLRNIWFSLSVGENDELWMWQKFSQSLADISLELSKQFVGHGLPQTSVDIDRILNIIRKTVKEPTVIVIDDYHENKSVHMNHLLTAIARASISKLHIVLISRSIPDISIDELALKGMCMELSQDQFEFNGEETVELFKRNGFLLSIEEQAMLVKNTDGWVAAIYLSLLKYAEDKTVEDIRDITRLIQTAVYDKFDKETQQVLLKLSLLDNFSLNGAIFVTGNKKAGELIREIEANNCFVRYNNKDGTYSIHAILKTMLMELFTISDIDKATLFSRCGDWCARSDRRIEAVDFYHRAGCYEKILDIYELPGSAELMERAPHIMVTAFIDMDKKLKLSYPLAYITYIYSYMLAIDTIEGASLLYEAKAIYEADDNLLDKEQILGEIVLIESILDFNDVSAMSEYHKKAYALFGGTSSQILNADSVFTCGSPHTLYLYHKKEEALLSLVELIEKDNWYHTHVSNGCGTGFEHVARAEYCLETGDLNNAELFAYKAIHKAKTKNQLSLIICGNLCLARLAILSGKPNEVLPLLEEVQAEAEAAGRPILLNSVDIAAGYIYGILGKLEQIPKWLQEGDISQNNLFHEGMGINYIVSARAAILRKSYAELEIIVETMKELYQSNNHIFGFIYAGIYDAIAKKHLYGMEKASEILLPAIKLAQSDGIITPFAESMPELEPILQKIKSTQYSAWTDKVLNLGERFTKSIQKINNQQETEPLTARELDVLTLLGEGFKQNEIAENLFLSNNTIRRHLQNIYEKLSVNNKTLAINKAKELNMIS